MSIASHLHYFEVALLQLLTCESRNIDSMKYLFVWDDSDCYTDDSLALHFSFHLFIQVLDPILLDVVVLPRIVMEIASTRVRKAIEYKAVRIFEITTSLASELMKTLELELERMWYPVVPLQPWI